MHSYINVFSQVFLLYSYSDTLDTVVSSHYQPATDLLAHSEHIYPQNHKSSIVFQLGQYTDGPLCKDLLDDQVILNHRMMPHKYDTVELNLNLTFTRV